MTNHQHNVYCSQITIDTTGTTEAGAKPFFHLIIAFIASQPNIVGHIVHKGHKAHKAFVALVNYAACP